MGDIGRVIVEKNRNNNGRDNWNKLYEKKMIQWKFTILMLMIVLLITLSNNTSDREDNDHKGMKCLS